MENQKKRRNSILKKSSQECQDTTETKLKRRISFSGKKSIKEFQAGEDAATIWGSSYEESAENLNLSAGGNVVDMTQKRIVLRNRKVVVAAGTDNKKKIKKPDILHPEQDKENFVVYKQPPVNQPSANQIDECISMDMSICDDQPVPTSSNTRVETVTSNALEMEDSKRVFSSTMDFIDNANSFRNLTIENSVDITLFDNENRRNRRVKGRQSSSQTNSVSDDNSTEITLFDNEKKWNQNCKDDLLRNVLNHQTSSLQLSSQSEDDWTDSISPSTSVIFSAEEAKKLKESHKKMFHEKIKENRDNTKTRQTINFNQSIAVDETLVVTAGNQNKRKTLVGDENMTLCEESIASQRDVKRKTITYKSGEDLDISLKSPLAKIHKSNANQRAVKGESEFHNKIDAMTFEETSLEEKKPAQSILRRGIFNFESSKKNIPSENSEDKTKTKNSILQLQRQHNVNESFLSVESSPRMEEDITSQSKNKRHTIHCAEDMVEETNNEIHLQQSKTNRKSVYDPVNIVEDTDDKIIPIIKAKLSKRQTINFINQSLDVSGLKPITDDIEECSITETHQQNEDAMQISLCEATLGIGSFTKKRRDTIHLHDEPLNETAIEEIHTNIDLVTTNHNEIISKPTLLSINDGEMDISVRPEMEFISKHTNKKRQTIHFGNADLDQTNSATSVPSLTDVCEETASIASSGNSVHIQKEDVDTMDISITDNVQEISKHKRQTIHFVENRLEETNVVRDITQDINQPRNHSSTILDSELGIKCDTPTLPETKYSEKSTIHVETNSNRQSIHYPQDMNVSNFLGSKELAPLETNSTSLNFLQDCTTSKQQSGMDTFSNLSQRSKRETINVCQDIMEDSIVATESAQSHSVQQKKIPLSNVISLESKTSDFKNRKTIHYQENIVDDSVISKIIDPLKRNTTSSNFLKNSNLSGRQSPLSCQHEDMDVKKNRQTIYFQDDVMDESMLHVESVANCRHGGIGSGRNRQTIYPQEDIIGESNVAGSNGIATIEKKSSSLSFLKANSRSNVFETTSTVDVIMKDSASNETKSSKEMQTLGLHKNRQTIHYHQTILNDSVVVGSDVSPEKIKQTSDDKSDFSRYRQAEAPEIGLRRNQQTIDYQQDVMDDSSLPETNIKPARIPTPTMDISVTEPSITKSISMNVRNRETIHFVNNNLDEYTINRQAEAPEIGLRRNRQTIHYQQDIIDGSSLPETNIKPARIPTPTMDISVTEPSITKSISKNVRNRETIHFVNKNLDEYTINRQAEAPEISLRKNRQTIHYQQDIVDDSSLAETNIKQARIPTPTMDISVTEPGITKSISKNVRNRETIHFVNNKLDEYTINRQAEAPEIGLWRNRQTILPETNIKPARIPTPTMDISDIEPSIAKSISKNVRNRENIHFVNNNLDEYTINRQAEAPEIGLRRNRQTIHYQQDIMDDSILPETNIKPARIPTPTMDISVTEPSIAKSISKNVRNRETIHFVNNNLDEYTINRQAEAREIGLRRNRETIHYQQDIMDDSILPETNIKPARIPTPTMDISVTEPSITKSISMNVRNRETIHFVNNNLDESLIKQNTNDNAKSVSPVIAYSMHSNDRHINNAFPTPVNRKSVIENRNILQNTPVQQQFPTTPKRKNVSRIPVKTPVKESSQGAVRKGTNANFSIYLEDDDLSRTVEITRRAPTRDDSVFFVDSIAGDAEKHMQFESNPTTLSDVSLFADKKLFSLASRNSMNLSKYTATHAKNSNETFSPNTTEALCNFEISKMPDCTLRKSRSSEFDDTAHNLAKYRKEYIEISDDIDKTRLSLIESSHLLDDDDVVVQCAEITCNQILDKEESFRMRANAQTSFVCKKCQCNSKSQNESTMIDFVLEPRKPCVVDLTRLLIDPTKLTINRVFDYWQGRRESNSFIDSESDLNETVYLPEVPSMKFLLDNKRKEKREELRKNRMPGAIFPTNVNYAVLVQNKMETEKTIWLLNTLLVHANVFEFTHRKVRSFAVLMRYSPNPDNLWEPVFDEIELKENVAYNSKDWTPFCCALHNQLLQELPYCIKTLFTSAGKIFEFLAKIDEVCQSILQLERELRLTLFDRGASLKQRSDGPIYVCKKVVKKTQSGTYQHSEFQIIVHNIRKVSFEDIVMPPLFKFSRAIQQLPSGIDFLQVFLTDPTHYLSSDCD